MEQDSQRRINACISMCKHFFREYAAEKDLDTEQMMRVAPSDFFRWCADRGDALCPSPFILATELELPEETVSIVVSILQDPFLAADHILPAWPLIVAQRRPDSDVPVGALLVNYTLIFKDATAFTFTQRCVESPEGWTGQLATLQPLTMPELAAFITMQSKMALSAIASHGLNFLHDQAMPVNRSVADIVVKGGASQG